MATPSQFRTMPRVLTGLRRILHVHAEGGNLFCRQLRASFPKCSTTYGVLRNLQAPDNPMSKTIEQITEKLHEHYEPKPSLISERCQFYKRNQNSGELIAAYITELCRTCCDFPREYLDDTLRGRLISGFKIQTLLLTCKA